MTIDYLGLLGEALGALDTIDESKAEAGDLREYARTKAGVLREKLRVTEIRNAVFMIDAVMNGGTRIEDALDHWMRLRRELEPMLNSPEMPAPPRIGP